MEKVVKEPHRICKINVVDDDGRPIIHYDLDKKGRLTIKLKKKRPRNLIILLDQLTDKKAKPEAPNSVFTPSLGANESPEEVDGIFFKFNEDYFDNDEDCLIFGDAYY